MGQQVTYEWVAEETDPETGDIENVAHFDTRAEAEAAPATTGLPIVIALLRSEGDPVRGETARYYAYPLPDGSMPERFSTGYREYDGPAVPERFRVALAAQVSK